MLFDWSFISAFILTLSKPSPSWYSFAARYQQMTKADMLQGFFMQALGTPLVVLVEILTWVPQLIFISWFATTSVFFYVFDQLVSTLYNVS